MFLTREFVIDISRFAVEKINPSLNENESNKTYELWSGYKSPNSSVMLSKIASREFGLDNISAN